MEPEPPEALISRFKLQRVLNQGIAPRASKLGFPLISTPDQSGRRITLLGEIDFKPTLLTAERAAFPSDQKALHAFHAAITNVQNLGNNDIYRWYLASSAITEGAPQDLKLNLIYPCTEKHVKKYSPQDVRMVTETPEIYTKYVRPYMERMREEGRLNWVFNIIEGRAEQEDILLREGAGSGSEEEGFLLMPDLNWDRKTLTGLHLLAIVERKDIWSLRDLKKEHVEWLKHMRTKVLNAAVTVYQDLEKDQLKLYIHYQPTYYHFHIHVVHVMCEATSTQAVGKAFGLDSIISQLEVMEGGPEGSMAHTTMTYFLGTASDLWTEVFFPLKNGTKR
ncbi:MAG: hypothetical protein Q9163_000947 [Psora crenata]